MNKEILQLAKEAGATNEIGGSADSGTVCFTHQEFHDFIQRFMQYQFEEIGVVTEDCNGYPWKRLSYTTENGLAKQAIGAKVYVAAKNASRFDEEG